ncbi:hypothetical protein G3N58_17930 [Paraburkholderia sp. Ac-20342]|uniref:hypothetical protein n=1 Tax=Paraburkholderia sp. Ac-20342 TaxID=2703889 RepID=UPI00197EE795|nr:hypothetical protein [Paraburkholderia sp. Ac-20342]MBN3848689.1 hypothetical protein [Paraburkholderia sp. Ac-20342]
MKSIVEQRGAVSFAEFTGERVYMREFHKQSGLPGDLSRWQSTVDQMLDGVDTDGPIFLMVDQSFVKAGTPQRRPGIHIDGYWIPSLQAHRGPGGHITKLGDWGNRWDQGIRYRDEALILASSVSACRALSGEWFGLPGEGGDCAHIDVGGLSEVRMKSGIAYAGNVAMLHESLPVERDCFRTLVRLNVPGWSPS